MWARIDASGQVVELIRHDPAGAYHPSITWVPVPEAFEPWIGTGDWVVTSDGRSVRPDSVDGLLARLTSAVAAERWRWQIGGFTRTGVTWHSDSAGRAALNEAITLGERYEAANGAGSWSSTWKARSGFVSVDLATLTAAGMAVGAFIQACFGREAEIIEALETAATAPDATAEDVIAAYDAEIGTGWPPNGIT